MTEEPAKHVPLNVLPHSGKVDQLREEMKYNPPARNLADQTIVDRALDPGTSPQQKKIREMRDFVDRNRANAATAARAQSRLKAIEKMDRIEAPQTDNSTLRIRLPEPPRSGQLVAISSLAAYRGLPKSAAYCAS